MDWTGSFLRWGTHSNGSRLLCFHPALCSVTETSRGASLLLWFLGLSYLLRAVGDISSEVLSLISPLGLVLRAQVYVNKSLLAPWTRLPRCSAADSSGVELNMLCDLEAGLVAAKPGPRHASRFLESPLGLVLRLERTTIIGWTIGMFILGASYGSVFGDVDEFVQTSELYQQMLPDIAGATVIGQFVAMLLSVMAMMAAVPALLVILEAQS